MLFENPYQCYLYSYPHKTAYRQFAEPIPLQQAIADREQDAAHLYVHIPYCQSRCGYCNLFTTIGTDPGDYVQSLRQHAYAWHDAGAAKAFRFLSFAIGGGTPLLLSPMQLQELFDIAGKYFQVSPALVPVSIETAPRQTTPERLTVLKDNRVHRVSIGIQSFHDRELKILNRAHETQVAVAALELLKKHDFPVLNIDLIYGIPEQTEESFLHSLAQAVAFAPQEIFLYPLYIRPQTILDRTLPAEQRNRQHAYRLYLLGRDYLLSRGFRQTSMRRFTTCTETEATPEFSCSEENMISLGCGGRSYIGKLHFSEHYAVAQTHCRKILQDYIARKQYSDIHYGFRLDEEESKRRFLMKNLLYYKGIDISLYAAAFDTLPQQDFPLLTDLAEAGLCTFDGHRWQLTATGLSYSDAIGPAFISNRVKQLMEQWKES